MPPTAPRPKETLVAEVTGEHPELARAELQAVLEIVGGEGLAQVAPLLFRATVPPGGAEEVARRGGLLRRVGSLLAEAANFEELAPGPLKVEGTFAVRATPLEGAPASLRSADVERKVGARFKGGRVDLLAPVHTFRVYVGERALLAHEVYDRDDDDFEERAVKHRPYFKPVSLHPKFARVLVNLTRVHDGETLLDPFCGTGGILIEAGLVGAHPVGIDAEEAAAAGARQNLDHFGVLGARVHHGLARDAPSLLECPITAIATDPPYGRAATTFKTGARAVMEDSAEGLADALAPGGRLALCVPELSMAAPLEALLEREITIPQRVHASLTRNYLVLRKGTV
ncbi:MAG TPA: hypothetical protein VJ547_03910 [Candidatus Thermoplasmatota archaeon]|nr:hypothetical protein [Candidatus Thermoplasmatota archaeon]